MNAPHPISLEDKYLLDSGRIYLTGTQALVRLPMIQRARDEAAGLNTAGFISGYRGSPLGGFDLALWKAKKYLEKYHIHFQPGVNEELAATAVWGSQQVNLYRGAKYDGVFAMWYGKGPGVDRCGDVFKHGNAAGTSKHGGVLLLTGDDHACKSSTLPHQSEHAFDAAMIPVLYPAGVQEIIELGLHGLAMSRYSGCWVAFKLVSDTVDSSASIDIDLYQPQILLPDDFDQPSGGMSIRWPDAPMEQELRLQHDKIYAALAYSRLNNLNRIVVDSPRPRLGIISAGKSFLDVMQALEDLGIDDEHAAEIGIRVYKVSMPWPLEPDGVRHFAEGLEEILVVEEKRQLLEYQMKEQLYNWREDVRPRVIGKYDDRGEWDIHRGEWLLPAAGELTPAMIARVIAQRIAKFYTSDRLKARLAFLEAKEKALAVPRERIQRIPYFCSGCPHNTSTVVPEGSRAMAGIGCHYMVLWMDRNTQTFTQMGGEGVPWIGQAPFTEESHVFANLGDGTYFHSGSLAIRAAVAAKVNMTYKLLFNDAVAMTGGQPVDGSLTVPQITKQLEGEGVRNIQVVTDDPEKYTDADFSPFTKIHHRDELNQVQLELRDTPGVSVLIYDQTCAAEKRRRRKRGTYPDPAKRVVINEAVCEGCGDCGAKSNCLSVVPLETEFGRKRTIDQSSCNKDFSCVKGFCPSFVTIEGGSLKKRKAALVDADTFGDLPTPMLTPITRPYNILVTGVGGTGVVTIGGILGMAAHIEGKGVAVLDMTGLAQKGGAVTSHIRLANTPQDIHAVRIAAGEADLVLGCDLVVAASDEALAKMQLGVTRGVINSYRSATGEFTRNPDAKFPAAGMHDAILDAIGDEKTDFVDATELATSLLGDSLATNLFIVGYAWQKGLIPISVDAILNAIELNGAAVDANKKSFLWGRRAAYDLPAVERFAKPKDALPTTQQLSTTLDEVIGRRAEYLTAYQDAAYAERYKKLVEKVREVEGKKCKGNTELVDAVARYYFKLLAYKDEYEVARLYTDGDFLKRINDQFEGDFKLVFHLAPPILQEKNPNGEPMKRTFGPWMLTAFKLLAKLKGLRGTKWDVFGYSEERKLERVLITNYEKIIQELLNGLNSTNHATAVAIASIPEHIRGFGHVKARHLEEAKRKQAQLLADFRTPAELKSIKVVAAKMPCL
ncbi:MAG: indolepyruvate ferredoxin oxidoreductase family protein [Pseudomonadota bacterium]